MYSGCPIPAGDARGKVQGRLGAGQPGHSGGNRQKAASVQQNCRANTILFFVGYVGCCICNVCHVLSVSVISMQVVMAFEEEFSIEIPDSEADKILSTREAIDFIASHPQAK